MTKGKLIKALILNAFVFPGSGYFVLNRRIRGFMLCSLVVFLLVALFFHVMLLARLIMQSQALPLVGGLKDFLNYNQQITSQVLKAHGEVLKVYLYLLLFCYGFGILDLMILFFVEKNQSVTGSKVM